MFTCFEDLMPAFWVAGPIIKTSTSTSPTRMAGGESYTAVLDDELNSDRRVIKNIALALLLGVSGLFLLVALVKYARSAPEKTFDVTVLPELPEELPAPVVPHTTVVKLYFNGLQQAAAAVPVKAAA